MPIYSSDEVVATDKAGNVYKLNEYESCWTEYDPDYVYWRNDIHYAFKTAL